MASSSPSKWVYITGCDSGFGLLSVPLFEKAGFKVVAGCFLDKSIEKLKSPTVEAIKLDVRNEGSVLDAAEQIKSILAKNPGDELYAVVNNAGILVQPCPAEWQSLKDFRDMFEVNVLGTVAVTNSVLPLIRASKGRIVCTSSIAGRVGLPTEAAYCVSKYGVQAYCDVLRRDMYPWGVTVHIVEPGVFPNTGLYERFQTGLDSVWARLDPQLKADYGEDYYKFVRQLLGFSLKEFGTTDNSLVPKAYVHAVTSPQAMYRYRVGADSKYLITLVSNLHESTADHLLTMPDPAGRLKTVRPVKAPKNGLELAWSRYDKGWPRFLIICAIVSLIVYKIRSKQ
jgi:NAD(P)-dependent dehydrogenase (short-subunit alcohol dehydrogenase family)